MIRLVAFDLDGTVLHGSNAVSEATLDTIRTLLDRDIGVAAISGRNFDRNQVPFRGDPALANALYAGCYNGGLVFGPGAGASRPLIHETRLPADVFLDLVRYVAEHDINFVYCRCDLDATGIHEIYMSDRKTEVSEAVAEMTGLTYDYDATLAERLLVGELGVPPKIMVLPEADRVEKTIDDLTHHFGNQIYMAWAVAGRIEIMHTKANKGVGLRAIAEAMGIGMDAVMAVGDGNNDLPMLSAAGVGVVMENADAGTRAAAGSEIWVAPTVAEDGFSEAVRRFVLT